MSFIYLHIHSNLWNDSLSLWMDRNRRSTRPQQEWWEGAKMWGNTDGRWARKKSRTDGQTDCHTHGKYRNKKVTFSWSLPSTEYTGIIGARVASNIFGRWYSHAIHLQTQGTWTTDEIEQRQRRRGQRNCKVKEGQAEEWDHPKEGVTV